MVADCAFEPKNVVSANVGMFKNQNRHQLDSHLGGNIVFNDHVNQAAFGSKGLGMPLQGNRSNVGQLIFQVMQKFQANIFTPNRVTISASGIENHQ